MNATKLVAIVVILFAYTCMAYGCNTAGLKKCQTEYEAKGKEFTPNTSRDTICKWANDYAGCLRPTLTGCPSEAIDMLKSVFNVYNKFPFNCNVTLLASGGGSPGSPLESTTPSGAANIFVAVPAMLMGLLAAVISLRRI